MKAQIAQDIYGGDLQSNPEYVRHMAHAIHSTEPLSYVYQLMAAMAQTVTTANVAPGR